MATKKPKHYCNNAELIVELIHYHETGHMTNKLGEMFINISRRLTGHSYFRHYDDIIKDELVGSAIVRMVEQIDMFNLSRCKFTYDDQAIKGIIYENDIVIVDDVEHVEDIELMKYIEDVDNYEGYEDYEYIDDVEYIIKEIKYKRIGYELVNVRNENDRLQLSKPNPFSYFTQVAWNCFVLECRRHYKQKNIKRKIAIDCFTNMESNVNYKIDSQLYDIMKEMIGDDDHYSKQRKKKLDAKKTKKVDA